MRQALGNFVSDAVAAETGIVLGYFPQLLAGVPASCTSNNECGNGGPCRSSICVQKVTTGSPALTYLRAADGRRFCRADGECASEESCRTVIAECVLPAGSAQAPNGARVSLSEDGAGVASPLCTAEADCAGLPGTTRQQMGICPDAAVCCEVSDYSAPAVPISAAVREAGALVDSLSARMPDG